MDQGAAAAIEPIDILQAGPEVLFICQLLVTAPRAADRDHRRVFAQKQGTLAIPSSRDLVDPAFLQLDGRREIDAAEQVDLERIGPAGPGTPVYCRRMTHVDF